MAIAWNIKTEFVGTEPVDKKFPEGDMTELTKITATHVETGNTYYLKARMGTKAYKEMTMDNIYSQHVERIKPLAVDELADEIKKGLEEREVSQCSINIGD